MSKYLLVPTSQFKKDVKKFLKQPKERADIQSVISILAEKGHSGLSKKLVPHKLKGNYKGYWECQIRPDMLLIWKQIEEPEKEIFLTRIGSHSDLF